VQETTKKIKATAKMKEVETGMAFVSEIDYGTMHTTQMDNANLFY
jgi:hypothetical protein